MQGSPHVRSSLSLCVRYRFIFEFCGCGCGCGPICCEWSLTSPLQASLSSTIVHPSSPSYRHEHHQRKLMRTSRHRHGHLRQAMTSIGVTPLGAAVWPKQLGVAMLSIEHLLRITSADGKARWNVSNDMLVTLDDKKYVTLHMQSSSARWREQESVQKNKELRGSASRCRRCT